MHEKISIKREKEEERKRRETHRETRHFILDSLLISGKRRTPSRLLQRDRSDGECLKGEIFAEYGSYYGSEEWLILRLLQKQLDIKTSFLRWVMFKKLVRINMSMIYWHIQSGDLLRHLADNYFSLVGTSKCFAELRRFHLWMWQVSREREREKLWRENERSCLAVNENK